MSHIQSVKDADVAGKRVLVRCDLDVLAGETIMDTRLQAAVPTLQLLRKKGAARIVVIGHAGRPGGTVVEALRMAPIATRLQELAGDNTIDVKENLRFDPREEANDPGFATELAALGDIFVNESFGDSHRVHASIVTLPTLLPSYAGLQFVEEIEHLTSALNPLSGALAVIGGAKFETKIPLIETLLKKYSQLLLGGALGNDVIKARGFPVGASLVSSIPAPVAIASDERLYVANDAVVKQTTTNAERTALVVDTQASEMIVDVGPRTAEAWAAKVSAAPFVLWNGPLGIYEEGFTRGTDTMAEALTKSGAQAVVGGGDTTAAVAKFNFDKNKVFVSTGGGAMLEFLATGTLPGIEALKG